ncbi:MAG TPA: CHAT domain-containing protein, partial [Pyrinomonadaceae bacterium]|nr:CHAT domain-containing protein [Pyrinomonadaceae bacterium]
FKVVEQGRARSLLDLLGETGTNITEGVPPDLLKRKQDNLDRQQEIEQLLTGVSATEGEKPDVSKLEAELETLSTEYDQIENQIRAGSPRYASLTAPQPLSLAEVQQQVLDERTALLEYSLGEERSFLWVATQSSVSLFRLPARSAVNQQAQDFRAQLIPPRLQRRIVGIDVAANQTRGLGLSSTPPPSGADAAAFVTASNALYNTAVQPAASTVGDRRLLVVADGALNYIPFEALVTAGGGADYSTLPYLIKTNEVVYAPSASVIAVVRKQSSRPTGHDVLLVADPVFNSLDPRASGAAASPSQAADTRGLGLQSALTDVAGDQANAASSNPQMKGLPLARLNGTHDEALQISRLVTTSGGRAEVWEGLKASEDNMQTQSIKQYRVVHIATHGLLDAERPQFTGVVLSLIGNQNSDGFLRTDEIFNLHLGSPLVMLSACETGLGRERRGEGVIGLTRAFMYAGAPTVGVSLWSVADQSTALLMTGFYKRLLTGQGESPSSAMRAAQLEMIQNKRYSAPFYWAPFVLVGEWRG